MLSGKERNTQYTGNFSVSNGASRSMLTPTFPRSSNNLGPSSLQSTSQKAERVSKIILFGLGQINREIQGAGGKHCYCVRKWQIPHVKHPCGLFAALMCGSRGQERLLSLQLPCTKAAKGRDQELLCCVT